MLFPIRMQLGTAAPMLQAANCACAIPPRPR